MLRTENDYSGISVEKAIFFDSYVAGNACEDSDINVAIISPELGQDRIEEMVMLKEIAEEIDYFPLVSADNLRATIIKGINIPCNK